MSPTLTELSHHNFLYKRSVKFPKKWKWWTLTFVKVFDGNLMISNAWPDPDVNDFVDDNTLIAMYIATNVLITLQTYYSVIMDDDNEYLRAWSLL